jgi:hypothetical protein
MPIPYGSAPPLTPPPTLILPTYTPSEAYQVTWTAPDGSVWPLTDPSVGWHTLDAIAGALGAAPITLTADAYSREGSIVRHIQPEARLITWPIKIDGPGEADYRSRSRALGLAFAQTRRLGPGTLTILRPDGTSRSIQAYYQGGFDPASGDMSGWLYGVMVLTLFCPSPFWVGPAEPPVTRGFVGGSPASFLSPYMTVSTSGTLGDTTVTNPGDVEAWPIIKIHGPASGAELTNNLTGETFSIDPNATGLAYGNLVLGETVTITTNPPAVRGPDGSIWTAALNFPSAVLWALQPGDNPVTLAITGAGTGSSIVLTYSPRYETA